MDNVSNASGGREVKKATQATVTSSEDQPDASTDSNMIEGNSMESTDADSGIEVKAALEKSEDDDSSWVKADYPNIEDSQENKQCTSVDSISSNHELPESSSETITNVSVTGDKKTDDDFLNNSSDSQNDNSFADFANFESSPVVNGKLNLS